MAADRKRASRGGASGGEAPEAFDRRWVVYCLVPADLAASLHEPLRRHFRERPEVDVIIEQRGRERRSGSDRRRRQEDLPTSGERRRIRAAHGRRLGERRAVLSELEAPELPRRARAHADRIRFVERLEPATEREEELDTARLLICMQTGDKDVFTTIYRRYFSRVYGYLRVTLRDAHEAEDVTQQVFVSALQAVPEYEVRPDRPFLAWLFKVARNAAIDTMRRQSHVVVTEPNEIDARREERIEEAVAANALTRLSDHDLSFLVERLPEPQRQALTMRYLLGRSTEEIAALLDRTPKAVRQLQSRGLRTLQARLTAMGRRDLRSGRARTVARLKPLPVLVPRRFALGGPLQPRSRPARSL